MYLQPSIVTPEFSSSSGSSGSISTQTNYKVATLVDGAGYKVRYTAGSYYNITQEGGEPTVIPLVLASNVPNSTSTTASVTIGTNSLWGSGSVHYVRSRVRALGDPQFCWNWKCWCVCKYKFIL